MAARAGPRPPGPPAAATASMPRAMPLPRSGRLAPVVAMAGAPCPPHRATVSACRRRPPAACRRRRRVSPAPSPPGAPADEQASGGSPRSRSWSGYNASRHATTRSPGGRCSARSRHSSGPSRSAAAKPLARPTCARPECAPPPPADGALPPRRGRAAKATISRRRARPHRAAVALRYSRTRRPMSPGRHDARGPRAHTHVGRRAGPQAQPPGSPPRSR